MFLRLRPAAAKEARHLVIPAPERTISEWKKGRHVEALKHLVDEIWVYGDQSVFDVVEAYQLPESVAEKIRYMGYISRPLCNHSNSRPQSGDGKRLLVTVGGGTDGSRLIDQYLSAPIEKLDEKNVHTTIVGGPDLPRASAEKFRRRAAEFANIQFEDFVP